MHSKELLVLAVYQSLGGVCIAGMTMEPDPVAGLRWVRPVREGGHVLPGDITTSGGVLLRPFDVVELNLLRPQPTPPHGEDWITDFVQRRPRVVRRLEGERRASFLHKYQDGDPHQVLDCHERSLCLLQPDWIKGCFRLDAYSGKFEARMGFGLDGKNYTGSYVKGGLPVTDLKWRALGRTWLPEDGGWTEFDAGDLEARFGIEEIYLAVGLTRLSVVGAGQSSSASTPYPTTKRMWIMTTSEHQASALSVATTVGGSMSEDILPTLGIAPADVPSLPAPDRSKLIGYLLRWQHYGAARRCLQQLLVTDSHLVSVYDNLARVYIAENRPQKAVEMMHRRHARGYPTLPGH